MTQERLYFQSRSNSNSTDTRQAIAVVQCSVVSSRAPAIVAIVVGLTTSILLLLW